MIAALTSLFASAQTGIAFMLVAILAFVAGMMAEHRVMRATLESALLTANDAIKRERRANQLMAEELEETTGRLLEVELELVNYRDERRLQ